MLEAHVAARKRSDWRISKFQELLYAAAGSLLTYIFNRATPTLSRIFEYRADELIIHGGEA
jgi:hypothetical protein